MKKTQLLHTILIENDIQVHVIVQKKNYRQIIYWKWKIEIPVSRLILMYHSISTCVYPPPPRHHIR